MRKNFYIILLLIFTACETKPLEDKQSRTETTKSSELIKTSNITVEEVDTTDYENATYYVVIADTNLSYYKLHEEMYKLSKKFNLQIDTMGRYFDTSKDLIALPEKDEDEMYAGDYFPRRFPSTTLSLEYLDFYKSEAGAKTIALVAGIYENETSADSALSILHKSEKQSFKLKSKMYIGCMH